MPGTSASLLSEAISHPMARPAHPMAFALLTLIESLYGGYRHDRVNRFHGVMLEIPNDNSRWLRSKLGYHMDRQGVLEADHYVIVAEDALQMRLNITYRFDSDNRVLAESECFDYYDLHPALNAIAYFLLRGHRWKKDEPHLVALGEQS